jgi:hypothetical protein
MYDTGLNQRLRPSGLDRVREATQAVTAHDQHVFEAPVADLGQHRQPDSWRLRRRPPNHTPSTCLRPSTSTPTTTYAGRLTTVPSVRTLTTMASMYRRGNAHCQEGGSAIR